MGEFRGIGVEFQIGLKTGPKFQFHSNHERGARPHRGGAGSARRGRRQQGYSRACFGRCYGLMRCPCLEGRAARQVGASTARPWRRRQRTPQPTTLQYGTEDAYLTGTAGLAMSVVLSFALRYTVSVEWCRLPKRETLCG